MKILFGSNELTETQMHTYELITQMHHETYGMNQMLKIAEKELGKVHKVTCDLRIALNKRVSDMRKEIDNLIDNGGEYAHLIEI